MNLELNDTEVSALRRALDVYLRQLRDEVVHTDDRAFRKALGEYELALERLRARI